MKIQVLGSGCATCHSLYGTVKDVVKEMKMDIEIEYSDDINILMALGVMSSPAFIIDDKLISAGRIPSNNEIKEAISGNVKISDNKDTGSCGGCCC